MTSDGLGEQLTRAVLAYIRRNAEVPDDYLDAITTFRIFVNPEQEIVLGMRFDVEEGCGDEEAVGFFDSDGKLQDAIYRCDGVREFIVKGGKAVS